MVIFHSFLYVYQRVTSLTSRLGHCSRASRDGPRLGPWRPGIAQKLAQVPWRWRKFHHQWIGLRENFNRKTPWSSWVNNYGFRFRFSQTNQSIDHEDGIKTSLNKKNHQKLSWYSTDHFFSYHWCSIDLFFFWHVRLLRGMRQLDTRVCCWSCDPWCIFWAMAGIWKTCSNVGHVGQMLMSFTKFHFGLIFWYILPKTWLWMLWVACQCSM